MEGKLTANIYSSIICPLISLILFRVRRNCGLTQHALGQEEKPIYCRAYTNIVVIENDVFFSLSVAASCIWSLCKNTQNLYRSSKVTIGAKLNEIKENLIVMLVIFCLLVITITL